MPRSRLARALLVLLLLASFAGASQAAFCPEVERCAMAGAIPEGVAPVCSPEMGGDCCEDGEAPASAPARDESSQPRAIVLLAIFSAPVVVEPIAGPGLRPADAMPASRLQAPVPLYTLLATLLI